MTAIEFEKLILQYASDIDYKVNKAFEKIKKPTYLSVEDVRSEVVAECWRAFQRWYHSEKSKPRTFMNRCIVSTLTDIIWQSWKEVKTKSLFVEHSEDSFMLDIPSSDESLKDFELPKTLTELECEYIISILAQQSLTHRQDRVVVRGLLLLSVEQERMIRTAIWQKLQESKNAAL